MTDRDLVARIARSAGGKAGYKQLVRELGLAGGRERRLLLEQLARLTARGALAKLDKYAQCLAAASDTSEGSDKASAGARRKAPASSAWPSWAVRSSRR